ncbi:YCF48-related protein [Variovorax ureilyticus]|uniref:YCF48-related protein n=1 Tax=Variovorax ureilyticus TaxID=1836198 RepID=A0ABU8VM14_9BURK
MHRRALLATLASFGTAWAAPVGSALDRPAVAVQSPSRSVFLGAALAGGRWVAVGERGLVVLSDDAGRSWKQAQVPVSVTLTAVAFADDRHGFATGHGGTVLATEDGGATWARRLDGRDIAALVQQDAMRGSDVNLQKAAQRLVADGPDKPLLDLIVASPSEVFVVGAFGLALDTIDGGKTWSLRSGRLDNAGNLHLYAARRRGQAVAIAGEQGLLLWSDDAGASFRRVAVPYQGSFFALELPGPDEIVVAGMRGNVWHSADAGGSWHPVRVPSPAAITGSALRPDGGYILASQAGQLLAGTGDALAALQAPPLPPLTGVVPVGGQALLALSVEGVHLVSINKSN